MAQMHGEKYAPWKTRGLDLIASLAKDDITLDPIVREEYKAVLWRSICSEYDSINFFNKIKSQKNIPYSSDFKIFLEKWLKDEEMHTEGFKKIYNLTYGDTYQEIEGQLRERTADFTHIEEFLDDEFKICLLLAYDEIVTAHVYERSMSFYQEVEGSMIPQWIKKVKYDEVKHFLGVIDVINTRHNGKAASVEKILMKIVDVDMNLKEYEGTFVLDHSCPEFPLTKNEIINICIKTILKKIT